MTTQPTVVQAAEFAAAWLELLNVLPNVAQVRITLRRNTGQWMATIGKYNATGTSEAEALRSLVEVLRNVRSS